MCGAWRITLSVPLSHNSQWMLLSADKAEAEAWRRHGEGKSPAQWPTRGAQSVLRSTNGLKIGLMNDAVTVHWKRSSYG